MSSRCLRMALKSRPLVDQYSESRRRALIHSSTISTVVSSITSTFRDIVQSKRMSFDRHREVTGTLPVINCRGARQNAG